MAQVLGRNVTFTIYNADGTSFHGLVMKKSVSDSVVMSLGDKITGDVYYRSNDLQFTMKEYITYNGINYILVNPPTIVKEGMSSDNSELKGMTKYSLTFYHPMYMLGNFPLRDVAVSNDEKQYLSEKRKFSWIGTPDDFIAKLNKNLQGTQWIVVKSDRFPQDLDNVLSQVLTFDENTIADGLKTMYDEWGVPYIIDQIKSGETYYSQGKRFKVVVGLPSNEIYASATDEQNNNPFVFEYGKGVGLKNNSRTPRNNKIVTRLSGFGSENNIPYGYPQVRWYGDTGRSFTYGDRTGVFTNVTIGGHTFAKIVSYPIYKGILGGAYVELIKHPFTREYLMPSIYRTTLFNKISFLNSDGTPNLNYDPDIELVDYYDAVSDAEHQYPNPINLQAPSFESHGFEDIKPELDPDGDYKLIAVTPLNNNLTPADKWVDDIDDDGNFLQSYFQITLPVLPFDIYACAAITEEMQINMRSGACIGCTFDVQVDWDDYKKNFYTQDGTFAPNGAQRNLTKYPNSSTGRITLILQKDNNTFGTLMPNIYQQPKGETTSGADDGDAFVILGISLPDTYITDAESRLDEEMKSYMLENNVYYFDYPLKFDEHFLATHTHILSQIKPNTVVRFEYAGTELELFVKQLTVKYGENVLPQYDITLTDNVEVTLNQIGQVADDVEKLSSLIAILRQSYGRNVWTELNKKLSKEKDDTAKGFIRMLQGIQVGASYIPDILGQGGVFSIDPQTGKVSLVTDYLYARVKAYFDTVEVRKFIHSGGNRIATKAGFKCVRVEGLDSNGEVTDVVANIVKYRCYYRANDGEDKVTNDFQIGDLAFCKTTNMNSVNQHGFHRLVIDKDNGNDYDSTNPNPHSLTPDGEGWIDLSNDPNSVTITIDGVQYSIAGYDSTNHDAPLAQDDIIQLGNIAIQDRQGAIVEYVGGVDSPSYQIYQGINSYNWTNTNQISLGYRTTGTGAGRAYMNVYGDMYIGAKPDPQTGVSPTYIEYKQSGTGGNPELNIKANINAQSTIGSQSLPDYIKDNQDHYSLDPDDVKAIMQDEIENLQEQIDGAIDTWFYDYMPVHEDASHAPDSTVPLVWLNNAHTIPCLPYYDWYVADHGGIQGEETTTERIKHLGDVFYDNKTGYAFRFSNTGTTANPVFEWTVITDSAVIKALANAAKAQSTADGKSTIFLVQPTAYSVGDQWLLQSNTTVNGVAYKAGDLLTASQTSDTFVESHWSKQLRYTDDTKYNGFITALLNGMPSGSDEATVEAALNAIKAALNQGTTISGGLVLSTLIGLRDSNSVLWAGISGQYTPSALGKGIAAWFGGAMADMGNMTTAQQTAWDAMTDQQKAADSTWAKTLFRFDGSGYLAANNIYWNAAGAMTIKNLDTIQGTAAGSTVDINTLSSLTSIFNTETYGTGSTTELLVKPRNAFSQLFINRTGTANASTSYPQDHSINDWSVLNYGEMKARFVPLDFFNALFAAFTSTSSSSPINPSTWTSSTIIDNLKVKVGFWTQQYISALGQNSGSGGGGGGATALTGLSDVAISNPTNGQVLKYNSTTGKWYNGTDSGVTSVAWSAITGKPSTISGYGISDAYISGGTITLGGNSITPITSLSGYATQSWVNTQLGSYLPLAGGTMTGCISKVGTSKAWYQGRDTSLIKTTSYSGYNALVSMKTTDGSWELGVYSSNTAHLTYITDANYNASTNNTTYQLTFPKATGTLALTSQIPTKASWNYDDVYLKLTGGTLNGKLTFNQTSSARDSGIVGVYNPNTVAAIWSMGSDYQIRADGTSLGSLCGAAYAYTGSGSYPFSGQGGDGHSFLWCENGVIKVAIGNCVWSRNGYKKNGATDSDVLLGNGGHAAISGLSVGNAATATKATNDSDGNAINSTYLKLTGGTMTGAAPIIFAINKLAFEFMADPMDRYGSRVQYMNRGNEALVFANKNSVTSYIFATGLDLANGNDWTSITPALQIKGQCVSINSLIANGVTPSINLNVNGNAHFSGGAKFYSICIECNNDNTSTGRSSEINNYTSHLYLQHNTSNNTYICSGGGKVGIGTASPSYKLHVSGDIYATGAVSCLSDERFKNIKGDTTLTVDQIAKMPSIKYTWNDGREDKDVHVGSIAQRWMEVLPEVVLKANDEVGTLSINYGVAAMIASITMARKVVDHERRIKELEKENMRLRTEIQQLTMKGA